MDPILERYQALEDKIKAYNPSLDTKRLYDAFNFADNAHAGQLRQDGTPYNPPPLAAAITRQPQKPATWRALSRHWRR